MSTRTLARAAMVAWLVNAVPHFVYHARHIGMAGMPGADRVGILVTLGFAMVAPVVVLWWTRTKPAPL